MLAAGLDDRDPVAAESLAVLGEAGFAPPRARELLRAAVPTASGTFLAAVATALHRLTAEESWAEAIVAVLGARHWTDRMDAAIALARFAPTADLVHALGRAVSTASTWCGTTRRAPSCGTRNRRTIPRPTLRSPCTAEPGCSS